MSGRKEQDLQREKWIAEKLVGQPQLLKAYMMSARARKKTSSTRKAYLGYLIQFMNFMEDQGIDVTKAKPMHLDPYVLFISEGNGHSIVNAKLAAVGDFYAFLSRNKLVKSNPYSTDLKFESETNDSVVYMTDPEVEQIKQRAVKRNAKHASRDLCIIKLGCSTGLRVSAIRNIDIEDIDFDKKIIHVIEKGNKKRDIRIGDETIEAIKDWMRDREQQYGTNSGALFLSQKKNRLSVRAIEEMIHDRAIEIDKHITPHKMRSTCAMKIYELTSDIYLTAQQLGHSNISNTQKYARATDDRSREVADLLDKCY